MTNRRPPRADSREKKKINNTMAKLFKKQNITDTLTNVGIGGAANVAVDYLVNSVDALKSLDPMYVKLAKVAIGALGGTMTGNKYLRAAVDGIATVGVSELVSDAVNGTLTTTKTGDGGAAGLPGGTIGRLMPGNRTFRRSTRRVAGLAPTGFMGK